MTSKVTRYPELGSRINQVVLLSGKSKGEFAEMIGVKPQNLSRWLSGEVAPQYEYMLKIGKLTERSMNWLCFGEKKKQPLSNESTSVDIYNADEKKEVEKLLRILRTKKEKTVSAIKQNLDAFLDNPDKEKEQHLQAAEEEAPYNNKKKNHS